MVRKRVMRWWANLLCAQFVMGLGASTLLASSLSESDALYRDAWQKVQQSDLDAASVLLTRFIERYPADERVAQVRVMRLSVLFDQAQYAQLILQVSETQEESPVYQEAASYMLAGAYCFSAEYDKAVLQAEHYLRTWSAGSFGKDVQYFSGVALARLGYAQQAREQLEQFIGSENFEYLAEALYEIALLDYSVGQYKAAQQRLLDLHRWVTEPQLEVQVSLLLARCYATLRDRETAAEYYAEALQYARDGELPEREQEVLFYTVEFYGRALVAGEPNPDILEAIPFAEAFFEKYPESVYAVQVATAVLPALERAGQLDVGVERLERLVRQACAKGDFEGVRKAAQTLVWKKIALNSSLREVQEGCLALPDGVYAAVLHFALSRVYEAGKRQAVTKWGSQLRFEVLERACYARLLSLSSEFDLPAYIHADLGWQLLEGGELVLARQQFEKAQQSKLPWQVDWAQLGKAAVQIQKRSLGAEGVALVGDLENLVARSGGNKKLRERAMYWLAHAYAIAGKWQELFELSKRYVNEEQFHFQRAELMLLQANACEKLDEIEEAIAIYTRIFATYLQNVEVSASAVDRLCVLTWLRNGPDAPNEPKDRQVAYQLGHRYLSLLEEVDVWRREQSNVRDTIENISNNVELWEQSGEVQTVEELLEDLRKRSRGIR